MPCRDAFLTGVTGAFSKALSVTMAAALAISWAMTAFVVPILARRLVDFDKWHDPGGAGEGRLAQGHDGALDRLSARPWLLAVIAVPLLAIGYLGYQQQQIAFSGLIKVFAAALVAELVLLLVLYRRFWLPVIIIGCSLLSTTSMFTALWLAGVDLNITALMGMTMIIGIGTEMAIFYVSEFEELAHTMPPEQATREAAATACAPSR